MTENDISTAVIGCAIKVHEELGPGLLESAYKECLCFELVKSGLVIEKEKPMPLTYQGIRMECGYRIDILVENKLVIEVKSVESLNDVHLAQVLTYLKLGKFKLGLLMNFNVVKMKLGVRRIANGL
jgi:GxxExxY protein